MRQSIIAVYPRLPISLWQSFYQQTKIPNLPLEDRKQIARFMIKMLIEARHLPVPSVQNGGYLQEAL